MDFVSRLIRKDNLRSEARDNVQESSKSFQWRKAARHEEREVRSAESVGL